MGQPPWQEHHGYSVIAPLDSDLTYCEVEVEVVVLSCQGETQVKACKLVLPKCHNGPNCDPVQCSVYCVLWYNGHQR